MSHEKLLLKHLPYTRVLKGQFNYIFDFLFSTDINSRAYSKTHHVFRISILHFNMRKIRKLVIAGQPKSLPGFLKSLPSFPKSLAGFPIRYMIMITEISNFLCCRQWKAYPVSQKVYTVSQKVYPISPGCLFRKPGRLFGKLRRLFGKAGRLFGKQGSR